MSTIYIDGPVAGLDSASIINRHLALNLQSLGHRILITPEKGNSVPVYSTALGQLAPLIADKRLPEKVEINIRNGWPPELTPPPDGKWVVIQPWEFGSLPKRWVEVFSRCVDEVWVPSGCVRDVYVTSGVPSEKVWVVPNGIDPTVFHPGAAPYRLKTQKKFKFLFVGGAIPRKGIDLLLEAYSSVFDSSDDVCLVIKDIGADSFYKGMSFREKIADLMKQPHTAAIEYMDTELTESELAGLYVACDVLVNPYRGEGFGMPILEAMACDTPTMITNGGAALDFCNQGNSILIEASEQIIGKKEVFGMETVDFPKIFKVNMEDFKSKLWWAAKNRDQLERLGRRAGAPVRANWTWAKTAKIADSRIRNIVGRPAKSENGHSDYAGSPGQSQGYVSTDSTGRRIHANRDGGPLEPDKDIPVVRQPNEKVENKYHYFDSSVFRDLAGLIRTQSDGERINVVRNFMEKFAGVGRFYAHFGGAGDALLLLSTFYDDSPEQTIVSISPSPDSIRSLFEAFPLLKRVYFIPYPEDFVAHILLRKLFNGMPGFLGMGTTPRDPYYFDEWGRVDDLTKNYSVKKSPDWARKFCANADKSSTIVIHPVGGISPLDKSVRKMITSEELTEIVRRLNEWNVTPTLIGTPAEASHYHLENLKVNIRRSYSFEDQMRVITSCRLLIGADSWAKTFAALCGKPAIVFHSLRGGTRSGYTEVGDNIFLKPWQTITIVNNITEMMSAFHNLYDLSDREFEPRLTQG